MDEPPINTLSPGVSDSVREPLETTSVKDAAHAKFGTDEARGERLHELIDRKFLKILTEAEAEELAELLAWRSRLKSEFYRNIPLAQK